MFPARHASQQASISKFNFVGLDCSMGSNVVGPKIVVFETGPGPARPWGPARHFRAGTQYSRFSHGPEIVDFILGIP